MDCTTEHDSVANFLKELTREHIGRPNVLQNVRAELEQMGFETSAYTFWGHGYSGDVFQDKQGNYEIQAGYAKSIKLKSGYVTTCFDVVHVVDQVRLHRIAKVTWLTEKVL